MMLAAPSRTPLSPAASDALGQAIESSFDCAKACLACAEASTAALESSLQDCIDISLDCAAICLAAGQIASRHTASIGPLVAVMLNAARDASRLCAAECGRHAEMHAHCAACAEACRACETACREAIDAIRREIVA